MEMSPGSSHDRKSNRERDRSLSPRLHRKPSSRVVSSLKRERSSRDERSNSNTPPSRSRRSNSRDRSARRHRDERRGGSERKRDRRESKGRREKKRSRSKSRHRSRTPKRSRRKERRRHSRTSDSSADEISTSLISEIAKFHNVKEINRHKKSSHKRKRQDSSSSSSTSEDIRVRKRGENISNGISTLNIPVPCPPPAPVDTSYLFYSQASARVQMPPPVPGAFMPPFPPPPPILTNEIQFPIPPYPMPPLPPLPPPGVVNQMQLSAPPPPIPPPVPPLAADMQIANAVENSHVPPATSKILLKNDLPVPGMMETLRIRPRPTAIIINRKGNRRHDIGGSDWGSTLLDDYILLEQIGEGTYGQVYKAVNKTTNEQVALKRVRLENEKDGFPITAVREIKILRQLNHKNIVRLIDIVTDNVAMQDLRSSRHVNFYLVFEYVDHDLMGLLESKDLFNVDEMQICNLFKQLLEGLAYCHKAGFLHRDIKCSNILVNNRGELKVADLGLARIWHEEMARPYTNRVITLWYRPPELLLGEEHYGQAIDVWSAGCMLGELFTRKPLFCGNNEITQLELISKTCGTPSPDLWPDVELLPLYQAYKPKKLYARRLYDEFKCIMPEKALNLLDKLLTLDPKRRVSARDALHHPWIRSLETRPSKPIQFPKNQDCHEMWSKKQKKKVQSLPSSSGPTQRLPNLQTAPRPFTYPFADNICDVQNSVRNYLENPYAAKNADEFTKSVANLTDDAAKVYLDVLVASVLASTLPKPPINENRNAVAKKQVATIVEFYLRKQPPANNLPGNGHSSSASVAQKQPATSFY